MNCDYCNKKIVFGDKPNGERHSNNELVCYACCPPAKVNKVHPRYEFPITFTEKFYVNIKF